jgi:hypothetical protein
MAMLYKYFPMLRKGDIRSTSMGAAGADLLLSPAALDAIGNYQFEVKRKKKLALSAWLKQAEEHGPYTPLVFAREDGETDGWVVILKAKDFFSLLPNSEGVFDEANKK